MCTEWTIKRHCGYKALEIVRCPKSLKPGNPPCSPPLKKWHKNKPGECAACQSRPTIGNPPVASESPIEEKHPEDEIHEEPSMIQQTEPSISSESVKSETGSPGKDGSQKRPTNHNPECQQAKTLDRKPTPVEQHFYYDTQNRYAILTVQRQKLKDKLADAQTKKGCRR